MYERFSDQSRRAMQSASQEAVRLGHAYIGTEHILLGLVKDGTGVAAQVLRDLNVDFGRIQHEVEAMLRSLSHPHALARLPPTPRAKKLIEYSIEEARSLGHNYIGTGHLLLGLLRERDGIAVRALVNLGIAADQLRELVLEALRGGTLTGEGKSSVVASEASSVVARDPGRTTPEAQGHPLVVKLTQTINEFSRQKEWCVAKQQFESAAALRDQCDAIRVILRQVVDLLKQHPDLGMTRTDGPADSP
jgi:ATP-dependent Clp protease ATP-binding subunit ClpC